MGRYYQAGKDPLSNVMFKGEEEVCELHGGLVGVLKHQRKRAGGVTKHNINAVNNLPAMEAFPGANVDNGGSSEPPAKQPAKPAAGVCNRISKRGRVASSSITNAVKNLAAMEAFPDDNVDNGSSPEPLAKQPAKPAVGVPARGRGGAEAKAGGGAFGSRAGRRAAVASVVAAATHEQQTRRRGGPGGRNRTQIMYSARPLPRASPPTAARPLTGTTAARAIAD
eukprot:jgi/Tetstr1/427211/TSEL_017399.t1